MDISDTLAPNSDQLDAVDLLGGPRIFTITKVAKSDSEQPISVTLAEFPRVWRPGKSMRRVLGFCWGTDASVWAGRQVELYCDPDVKFGGDKVGGTRISRLSHIDAPKSVPLLVTRGKSALFTVRPLPVVAARDWRAEADALADPAKLRDLWKQAPPEAQAYIAARAQSLTSAEPSAEGVQA